MKIAALLNVHAEPEVVADTLDSIRTYMTDQVLVLVDAASTQATQRLPGGVEVLRPADPFPGLPAHRMEGFFHGRTRSPYRNIMLGLKTLGENWRDVDWYCYIEYDCLVASSDFKDDLSAAGSRGVFAIGNDHRRANYALPFLERVLGRRLGESHILLGCCVFYHRRFIRQLLADDFFCRFLNATNPFQEFFPGFEDLGAYDVAEVVLPTLAANYGGGVEEFGHWDEGVGWSGEGERYPMRFRPDLAMEYPRACILHPLKTFDHPMRAYCRERRKRQGTWGSEP